MSLLCQAVPAVCSAKGVESGLSVTTPWDLYVKLLTFQTQCSPRPILQLGFLWFVTQGLRLLLPLPLY